MRNSKCYAENFRLRKYIRYLQGMIETDIQTGLKNRRAVENYIRQELKRNDVGILLLDIDNFQKINDTYGHPAGDVVINVISRIIQASVRSNTIIARWGGDEFIVAIPKTNEKKLFGIAERIRKNIERRTTTTITIGISLAGSSSNFSNIEKKISNLFFRADDAMYAAKKAGKNKSQIYSEKGLFFF